MRATLFGRNAGEQRIGARIKAVGIDPECGIKRCTAITDVDLVLDERPGKDIVGRRERLRREYLPKWWDGAASDADLAGFRRITANDDAVFDAVAADREVDLPGYAEDPVVEAVAVAPKIQTNAPAPTLAVIVPSPEARFNSRGMLVIGGVLLAAAGLIFLLMFRRSRTPQASLISRSMSQK